MYVRAFAEAWNADEIVQQPVGQLPWGHNVLLLTRLKDRVLRLRYADQASHEGWSRTTLELQIKNRLHERQGRAITNFEAGLPAPHSDLAHETLRALRH